MPERTVKVAHTYGGRFRTVGTVFHVDPQDVRVMLILGHIEPVEGEAGYKEPSDPQTYLTRDMGAEKRAYRRKGTQ